MNKQSLAVFTLLCVTCASGPAFAENRIGKVWHSRSAAYKLVHHNYETWLKPRIATAVQSVPGKELKERYLGLVGGPLRALAAPPHSAMSNLTAVPNVTGMPSMSLNSGIRSQPQLYAQGQQNVARIFNECIQQSSTLQARGIDPGNCGATLESAQAAIANMNTAAQSYITPTPRNLNIKRQVGGDAGKAAPH
jgi:hypothetical protein